MTDDNYGNLAWTCEEELRRLYKERNAEITELCSENGLLREQVELYKKAILERK